MILEKALLTSYLLGILVALMKSVRYWMEYERNKQRFYLIGVPTNLALFAVVLLLAGATWGAWSGMWMRYLIVFTLLTWAILALIFEILYVRTFVRVSQDVIEETDDEYQDDC